MRTLILAAMAALVLSVQMVASVKAEEDTTVIRRDHDGDRGSTTVIKKEETGVLPLPLPVPREEKKVIIHRDGD